jgi:transposase
MGEIRQRYTSDFKERTVRYIQKQNKSMPELAEELNLPVKLLHDWKAKHRQLPSEPPVGGVNLYAQDQEIKELREQVKEREEEIAILKKAMHIFSKDRK